MGIEPDALNALLDRWPVGRLATVTAIGEPHVVPVVFVADSGCLYSPVDGKRKSTTVLARVRNVEAHGRASIVLDHYDDDWLRLWWVRLEGPAWVERDDGALLARVERLLRRKYPQYGRDIAPYAGEPTLLALRWERVSAWAQAGTPPGGYALGTTRQ